jgi:radical SAM superfamily enzyme YgiQ (UPF0313 family)
MKICLLVPRSLNPKQTYREYPLGAGLVATALAQQGHDVFLYDQVAEGPDDEAFFARLRQFQPEVVGLSIITPSYPVAREQIGRIRAELPGVAIVAGGIHPSLFPEDLLADGADAVVIGEGQRAMTELVERIAGGDGWQECCPLSLRERVRVRACLEKPSPFDVRSSLASAHPDPLPEGEGGLIINREVYNLPLYTHHSMMASLGCPYHCAFCYNFAGTILHEGVTLRPLDCIFREMHYLSDRYGAKRIFFADDVFLLHRRNVLAFCRRMLEEKLNLEWVVQMRVDTIDPEVAEAMAAANCRRVYFGVEAGSEGILRRIRKGIDKEAIRQGVRSAKQAGLRVKTGWMYGLPGTLAEQYEAIDFMRELRPHEISIHKLIPFPGTDYYQRPAEFGMRIRDPKDFASFCFGGLGDNITFDYLSHAELVRLLETTVAALESDGYVSSDRATARDEYVYSTPLSAMSMTVFRTNGEGRP